MGKTEIIDLGWENIIKELRKADNSFTKVGLQEGEKAEDMSDLVLVGAVNEFGTKRIPARPFIRSTFDDNRQGLFALVDRLYDKILAGRTDATRALALIGTWLEGKTKKQIVDIKDPENAPSTIASKGSSNPLIDTGQMRQGIRHVEVIR